MGRPGATDMTDRRFPLCFVFLVALAGLLVLPLFVGRPHSVAALEAAGVRVAGHPGEIAEAVAALM